MISSARSKSLSQKIHKMKCTAEAKNKWRNRPTSNGIPANLGPPFPVIYLEFTFGTHSAARLFVFVCWLAMFPPTTPNLPPTPAPTLSSSTLLWPPIEFGFIAFIVVAAPCWLLAAGC